VPAFNKVFPNYDTSVFAAFKPAVSLDKSSEFVLTFIAFVNSCCNNSAASAAAFILLSSTSKLIFLVYKLRSDFDRLDKDFSAALVSAVTPNTYCVILAMY
jgi:hypothetical protein